MDNPKDIALVVVRNYDTGRARAAYEEGKRLDEQNQEPEYQPEEQEVNDLQLPKKGPLTMWLDLIRK